MATDRWKVISRIYHEALDRPADARDAFIREACIGDKEIEQEVRSLLAQSSSDSFLHALMPERSAVAVDSARLTLTGRLGRFEVRGLLGAGGMGEVYRAHDASLGRDVAVKILPSAFSTDPERLARFEREARVLAALSHPHIATIYGVEEIALEPGSDGTAPRALVLELVEGETLFERLGRGRLSTAEALEIARQIADGLEAAHEKGIVHRDLKPSNIKIRSDGLVKILDFGLAKAEGLTAGRPLGAADHGSAGETSAGVVLGTPAYMSPEQARGLAVDKRTDIWAFGCVLYEMLAGRAPFIGETPADIIATVLQREPDWQAIPETTPVAVRRLLRRCLDKNPKRRLRDMGDARFDLDTEQDAPVLPPSRTSGWRIYTWLGATALVAAAVVMGAWLWPRTPPEPVQFTLSAPDGHTLADVPVPSPDGRHLVFLASTFSGEFALWVRPLGSSSARRLAGTENARNPFWSPDGQFVGFTADSVLKRTAVIGGPVQRIADLDPTTLGAAWNRDNVIVFTPSNKAPLRRVSAAGGTSEPLTSLNADRRENSHRWPQFLPDGRHFIFTARSDMPEHTGIYVASLDRSEPPKWLLAAQSSAVYVSPGYLLFVRDNTLLARPFDVRALAFSGEPVAVAGDVRAETSSASGHFAASADGTVVTYNTVGTPRLVWFDRSGAELGAVALRGTFAQVRLSPDGSRAAVVMPDPQSGNRDVWVIGLANGGITRITSHPAADWFPVWSPDGSEIVFVSDRNETSTFYRAPATGGGSERQVFRASSREAVFPTDWSLDGRALLFHSYPRGDVSLLPLSTPAGPAPLVESPFTDWVASFSPDGRWIAYVSDESGAWEVYVRAVDQPSRHRVSVGGGTQPRWRRDGRELYFIGPGDKLFAAALGTAETFTVDTPTPLFKACQTERGRDVRSAFMYRYDVTADGNRSLWICAGSDNALATVAVHALSALTR